MRCIISNYGTVTENASKFVKGILNDFVSEDESSCIVSSVKQLKDEVKKLDLPKDDYILASIDVTNMFGSINLVSALEIITNLVFKKQDFHQRYNLNPDDFLELVSIVLNNSFFEHEGLFYKQINGIPMGSGASPIIADLVMLDWERKMAKVLGFENILLYKRYRDDCLMAWKGEGDTLIEFLGRINEIDESLQFTLELEVKGSLPFLDAKLTRHEGEILFRTYAKPYSSDILMDYNSFHDDKTKGSIIIGETTRYWNISDNLDEDVKSLESKFRENHFPTDFTSKTIAKTRSRLSNNSGSKKIRELDEKFLTISYPGKTKAKEVKRICRSFGLKVAFKKRVNLEGWFSGKYKRRSSVNTTKGVVYQLECRCGKIYIGETGDLNSRIYGHKYSIKTLDLNNGPAAHSVECNRGIDWEKVAVLEKETNWYKRKIAEGLWIQKRKPELNLSKGYPVKGNWN